MGAVLDFFKFVLEHGGTTALLYVITIFAFAAGFRALWKQNGKLSTELTELRESHALALAAKAEEYAQRTAEREREHDEETMTLVQRIDALQESRVQETRDVTEKVVAHVGEVTHSVGGMRQAVETLIRLGERG